MAELSLPVSPSDGDTITHEGTKFTYVQAKDRWDREITNERIELVVPTTNTSITTTAISGNNLVFTQADGSTANVNLSSLAGGQVTTYATEADLPSDADAGSHGFVTANDFLYVKATNGWYKITSVNLSPSVTASIDTHAFTLENESIDITYTVTEPEDTPVTITISNTGISNTDQLTVTHHASNNTITAVAGNTAISNGQLIISASDGVNIGTDTIAVTFSTRVIISGHSKDAAKMGAGFAAMYQWNGHSLTQSEKDANDATAISAHRLKYIIYGGYPKLWLNFNETVKLKAFRYAGGWTSAGGGSSPSSGTPQTQIFDVDTNSYRDIHALEGGYVGDYNWNDNLNSGNGYRISGLYFNLLARQGGNNNSSIALLLAPDS